LNQDGFRKEGYHEDDSVNDVTPPCTTRRGQSDLEVIMSFFRGELVQSRALIAARRAEESPEVREVRSDMNRSGRIGARPL